MADLAQLESKIGRLHTTTLRLAALTSKLIEENQTMRRQLAALARYFDLPGRKPNNRKLRVPSWAGRAP
jgi:hypothetical protein